MTPPRYRLLLSRSAEKELDRLMRSDRARVEAGVSALADDPRPRACAKLVAHEGYRVKVGVYRVSYVVEDDAFVVTVYSVLHRKDAYP